jgi:hypothetical protein
MGHEVKLIHASSDNVDDTDSCVDISTANSIRFRSYQAAPYLKCSGNHVLASLAVYCAVGASLTLVNKLAIDEFPTPNTLLAFQNGFTVALVMFFNKVLAQFSTQDTEAIPPVTSEVIQTWFPAVLLFVGALEASLLALLYESATTLIVSRNLCTIVVAGLEYLLLGTRFSALSVTALLGILFGVISYGFNDATYSASGYAWLGVNIVCTAMTQICIKLITLKYHKENRPFGPLTMSYYYNIISLPLLACAGAAFGELPRMFKMAQKFSRMQAIITFFSVFLAFASSVMGFVINNMTTSTTTMVANCFIEFAVILLSEFFVEQTLTSLSMCGAVIAMFFALFFSVTMDGAPEVWTYRSLQRIRPMGVTCLVVCTLCAAVLFLSSLVHEPLWQIMPGSGPESVAPVAWIKKYSSVGLSAGLLLLNTSSLVPNFTQIVEEFTFAIANHTNASLLIPTR